MTTLQAVSPVLALAINCAMQVVICRRTGALLRSVYLAFTTGLAACALLCGFSAELFPELITYGALGYCYFHFLNLGETARRIRIVREISEAGSSGLSKEEILSKYNSKIIIAARLSRLISKTQIIEKDGRYYLGKPTVLYMANALLMMKKLLLGKSSESI